MELTNLCQLLLGVIGLAIANEVAVSENVEGQPLGLCSMNPVTGFYRDGYCRTDASDSGTHTVCAVMTDDFLQYTKSQGNDLSTPAPQYQFPGLKAGDKWCLCALRWNQANQVGKAPKVFFAATNAVTIEHQFGVTLADLEAHRAT